MAAGGLSSLRRASLFSTRGTATILSHPGTSHAVLERFDELAGVDLLEQLAMRKQCVSESVLNNLQLIFLVDISGSMEELDVDPDGVGRNGLLGRGKWTRFDNLIKILKSMTAELIKFDKNGKLPVYFFNDKVVRTEVEYPNILLANAKRYKPGGMEQQPQIAAMLAQYP